MRTIRGFHPLITPRESEKQKTKTLKPRLLRKKKRLPQWEKDPLITPLRRRKHKKTKKDKKIKNNPEAFPLCRHPLNASIRGPQY